MKFFEDIRVGETVEIGSHVFTAEDIKTFAQRFDGFCACSGGG